MKRPSKKIVKDLKLSTNAKEFDWFGVKITKENYLTVHHCFKQVYGGNHDIENLSLLSRTTHERLHQIEHENRALYNEINDILLSIDRTKEVPEETQKKLIKKLKGGGYE